MPDDRISKLSQRFRTHALGRPRSSGRNRERHSFYLDAELVQQLDKAYRDSNHELYPRTSVTKSEFLETLMGYGLAHLAEIKALLSDSEDSGHISPSS